MSTRVKRTYNLSAESIRRVRELASEYGVAETQDAVVELAIDQLYLEKRDAEEAARWTAASQDPDFRREMASVAGEMRDGQEWPR
jgi:hypothetical protein